MKKYSLFLFFALVLVACASSTPMPTETPIPTATSTLTPVPTIIPTATPEPWIAIVEEYDLPEEMAKEVGAQNFTVEEALYGRVLKDETGTVLFEEIRGEWLEAKNYDWVISFEDFQNSFVPYEEILNGSLYAWVFREVIPNVDFEDSQTDETKLMHCCGISYLEGYSHRSIKGAAYFNTRVDNRDYRVIVNIYEDAKGGKWPITLVYRYSGNYFENINKFWSEMRTAPVLVSPIDIFGEEDAFVSKSQELLGDNLTLDDIREFIPEKAAEFDVAIEESGRSLTNYAMTHLFALLTPEQQAEFKPGVGGLVLAIYGFERGNPSFMSYPGVVFHTFAYGQ